MGKETYFSEAALKDKPQRKLSLIIKDGSVTTKKLADDAVTTPKISDGSVTSEKLATDIIDKITEKLSGSFVPITGGVVTGDLEAKKFIKTDGKEYELLAADGSVATPITKDELDGIASIEACCSPIKDEVVDSILEGSYNGDSDNKDDDNNEETKECDCEEITDNEINNVLNNN